MLEAPVINGDGNYSRDFTYIDNVIQANELAAILPKEDILGKLKDYYSELGRKEGIVIDTPTVIMEVFNVAYGGNTTLFQLFEALKSNLAQHNQDIAQIEVSVGEKRVGDIPHSLASVDKAKRVLGYKPEFNAAQGFASACKWYINNFK